MAPKYPSSLGPDTLPPGVASKSQRSRSRREPSGAFQLFQASQIKQFKEAFSLIDHDGDGVVSEKDLKNVFGNLGERMTPSPSMLDSLLNARPGANFRIPTGVDEEDMPDKGVNFPMFLTMMGERLFEFDTEPELLEAFECFDDNDTGTVKVAEVRKFLSEMGDKMSEEEIDRLLKGSFTDRQGNFRYREWIKVVRVNEEDEETEAQ